MSPEAIRMGVSLTDAGTMAVLGSMASIEICAASKLDSEIASGHMRLVAAISEDRHLVYTMDVSEPVLARAAHLLIVDGIVMELHTRQILCHPAQ